MTSNTSNNPNDRDWEQERTQFLNHPEHGHVFFDRLNRKIAACVAPGQPTWEDVAAEDRFQQAFDFIMERLLSLGGFRSAVEKHEAYKEIDEEEKDTDPRLFLWEFLDNRVSLVLAEWNSARRDQPGVRVKNDEHIQQKGSGGLHKTTQQPRIDFESLMKRIALLRQSYQATLLLWIWPLSSFPDSWREKFEPLILNAGEKNGISREEVKRRLDEVMSKSGPVSDDAMLEAEARLGTHFEKTKLFDGRKRNLFGKLEHLRELGSYSPDASLGEELKCDCYQAVKQDSELDAVAAFDDHEIYQQLASGRRRLKNRPLWVRRRFSFCCYKQKYHRRVWLNTSLKLLVQQPVNGPMSYPDISWILNCPENTTAANLSRARKALLERTDSEDADDYLANFSGNDVKEAKAQWQAQLKPDSLHAHVCENLEPKPVGISSKPSL